MNELTNIRTLFDRVYEFVRKIQERIYEDAIQFLSRLKGKELGINIIEGEPILYYPQILGRILESCPQIDFTLGNAILCPERIFQLFKENFEIEMINENAFKIIGIRNLLFSASRHNIGPQNSFYETGINPDMFFQQISDSWGELIRRENYRLLSAVLPLNDILSKMFLLVAPLLLVPQLRTAVTPTQIYFLTKTRDLESARENPYEVSDILLLLYSTILNSNYNKFDVNLMISREPEHMGETFLKTLPPMVLNMLKQNEILEPFVHVGAINREVLNDILKRERGEIGALPFIIYVEYLEDNIIRRWEEDTDSFLHELYRYVDQWIGRTVTPFPENLFSFENVFSIDLEIILTANQGLRTRSAYIADLVRAACSTALRNWRERINVKFKSIGVSINVYTTPSFLIPPAVLVRLGIKPLEFFKLIKESFNISYNDIEYPLEYTLESMRETFNNCGGTIKHHLDSISANWQDFPGFFRSLEGS